MCFRRDNIWEEKGERLRYETGEDKVNHIKEEYPSTTLAQQGPREVGSVGYKPTD